MVERQTENLKVESSILFTDIVINFMLLIPYKNNNKTHILLKKNTDINTSKKYFPQNVYLVNTNNKKFYYSFLNYQTFNNIYLQNIFKLNLKEKYLNALHTIPKKSAKYILFKMRFKSFKHFNIKYFNEVLYMLIVNF